MVLKENYVRLKGKLIIFNLEVQYTYAEWGNWGRVKRKGV